MKNLKDILEQWKPKPGVKPIETDSEESTTAIDRIRDGFNLNGNDEGGGFLDRIGVTGGDLFGPEGDKEVTDPRYGWTIKKKSDNSSINQNLESAINDADEYTSNNIAIEVLDNGNERLVLMGKTQKGIHHLFPIQKQGSEWGWVDDVDYDGNPLPENEHKWYKFSQY